MDRHHVSGGIADQHVGPAVAQKYHEVRPPALMPYAIDGMLREVGVSRPLEDDSRCHATEAVIEVENGAEGPRGREVKRTECPRDIVHPITGLPYALEGPHWRHFRAGHGLLLPARPIRKPCLVLPAAAGRAQSTMHTPIGRRVRDLPCGSGINYSERWQG